MRFATNNLHQIVAILGDDDHAPDYLTVHEVDRQRLFAFHNEDGSVSAWSNDMILGYCYEIAYHTEPVLDDEGEQVYDEDGLPMFVVDESQVVGYSLYPYKNIDALLLHEQQSARLDAMQAQIRRLQEVIQ
ncbi:MAG: hypothetical protein FWE76_01865 [Symbiobacteriaceae bacterium]|nr:hypothetical protein [Symbiobacteriaceae bacterium]